MNVLSHANIDLIAGRSRALGDATRVRMLIALDKGEQSVGQIARVVVTQQSTASKHLQVLFHTGLVQRRRETSTVMYSLPARPLLSWLRALAPRDLGSAAGRMNSSHRLADRKAAQRTRR